MCDAMQDTMPSPKMLNRGRFSTSLFGLCSRCGENALRDGENRTLCCGVVNNRRTRRRIGAKVEDCPKRSSV